MKPANHCPSTHQAALSVIWNSNYSMIDELINSKDPRREKKIITGEQRRNTRTILAEMTQKVGGSNGYPDPAPKKVGGSGPRKTHRIYAPGRSNLGRGHITATCTWSLYFTVVWHMFPQKCPFLGHLEPSNIRFLGARLQSSLPLIGSAVLVLS